MRAYALVDDADFEWLSQWRWSLNGRGYVSRTEYLRLSNGKERKRAILMHRVILGLERGDPRQGEHENRNRLDCRRSNLRIAERGMLDNGQNVGPPGNNTSGYRGVSWHKRLRKWRARVWLAGKEYHLGWFDTVEEADEACKAFRAQYMPFSEDAAA